MNDTAPVIDISLSNLPIEQVEGCKETPRRVAEAWEFWTSGYGQDPGKVLKTFDAGNCDEMVFQGAISLWSTCEHHLAPFWGVAHIGYIPKGRVVGLSKLARLVDVFARRLSLQERLTQQVADAIDYYLDPVGVGVVLQCRHSCMESRGVQRMGTITLTSALKGAIKEKVKARAEFMGLVQVASGGLRTL